jgi:hypothetical protein
MSKRFNIHEWQAKQRSLTEGYIGDDSLEDVMKRGTADTMLWHVATLTDANILEPNEKEKALKALGHPNVGQAEDDFDRFLNDPYLEEQGFDDRLAQQMGMSDDEFEDQIASRDIGSPFPGTDDDDVSNGYKAAQALKDELRNITYKKLSDEELDTSSSSVPGNGLPMSLDAIWSSNSSSDIPIC